MDTYGLTFTWSRVAHNVVEHLAAPSTEDDPFQMPLCGRELSIRTQTLGQRNPTWPMCHRCESILTRIVQAADRYLDGDPATPEPTDENLHVVFRQQPRNVREAMRPPRPELYPLIRQVVEAKRVALSD